MTPDDPVTADARSRIGLLRSYAAAIVNTPEALDLDAVMRRFEGALDAVLKLHQPRQLYQAVEDYRGHPQCGHDPDKDWDQHFEADDGAWYCLDKPTVKVCPACTDDGNPEFFAEWPCPTVQDFARALTGEASDGD